MISASLAAVTPSARRCAASSVVAQRERALQPRQSACSASTWRPNWSADGEAGERVAARRACAARWRAPACPRAPRSARRRRRGRRPGGNAATAPPPAGSGAAATGRRRGWCRCACRPAGRAPWRTARARRASVCSVGSTSSSRSSPSSAASSSVTHLPRVFCSRTAISAAAALVKVRHWMRSGLAPASIRRSSRSVSSLVLPEPAEAATKADTAGSEASSCSALARSRAPSPPPPQGEGTQRSPSPCGRGSGGGGRHGHVFPRRRPFRDARELRVVGEARRVAGLRMRQVAAVRRVIGVDQRAQRVTRFPRRRAIASDRP